MKINDDRMCFACGEDNPISLKLSFELIDEKKAEAFFRPESVHQGYSNIMHGGLVTTLLDEAMAKVLELNNILAVTGEINVRFKKKVKVEQRLQIIGEIKDSYHDKLYYNYAELRGEDGELLATAEAKFMRVEAE